MDLRSHTLSEKECEHIRQVFERARTLGGIAMSAAKRRNYESWFRTLARRGVTTVEAMSDPDGIAKTFGQLFPNPMTRAQFIRSILHYLTWLTDEEYEVEYGKIDRETTVAGLKALVTQANRERKLNAPNAAPSE